MPWRLSLRAPLAGPQHGSSRVSRRFPLPVAAGSKGIVGSLGTARRSPDTGPRSSSGGCRTQRPVPSTAMRAGMRRCARAGRGPELPVVGPGFAPVRLSCCRDEVAVEVEPAVRAVHRNRVIPLCFAVRQPFTGAGAPSVEPLECLLPFVFRESPEHRSGVREDDAHERIRRIPWVHPPRLLRPRVNLVPSLCAARSQDSSSTVVLPPRTAQMGPKCRAHTGAIAGRAAIAAVRRSTFGTYAGRQCSCWAQRLTTAR